MIQAESGQRLDLGQGAFLEVLSANDDGAVLLLEWASFRLLLPIGLDARALRDLQGDPRLGPVTVLLLPDGGSVELSPPEWIANLQPQVILLSVSALNREGLLSLETLVAIEGYTLMRTDRNGWIELTTDR